MTLHRQTYSPTDWHRIRSAELRAEEAQRRQVERDRRRWKLRETIELVVVSLPWLVMLGWVVTGVPCGR